MTKHHKALLDLSTLISPVTAEHTMLNDIMLSEDTPWDEIIDFANQHLLIPALYDALEEKDLLKLIKNKKMLEYLSVVYDFNRIRNEAIVVQIQEICHLFAEISVTPVLLKGGASLSEGYHHGIGSRVMMDLDILVPEDKILKCIELLESKGGYQPIDIESQAWTKHGHHYRRIYNETGVAALELHRNSLGKGYAYFKDSVLMEHVRYSKTIENAYVIEPSFEFYHEFLHSEISHSYHKDNILGLRHLRNAAVISTMCHKEMDWDLLIKEVDQYKDLAPIFKDYLSTLKILFDIEVPLEALGSEVHFQKIIYTMDNNNSKDVVFLGYIKDIKKTFSYEELQERYQIKSRLLYPLAFIKNLFRIFNKYIFSSNYRKNMSERHQRFVKSRKYGQ